MNWKAIEGTEQLVSNNTNYSRTVRVMQRIAQIGAEHDQVKKLAAEIMPGDYKKLFDTIFNKVVYEPDPKHEQRIRYPHRTLKDQQGNCVDYVVLISSVLHNWAKPHWYRVVDFGDGFEHIYIVVDGVVIDPVIGQRQDGSENFANRSKGSFNTEIEYKRKKDFFIMPTLKVLGRTPQYKANTGFYEACRPVMNGFRFSDLLYLTPAAPFKIFADFVAPQIDKARDQAQNYNPYTQPTTPNYNNNLDQNIQNSGGGTSFLSSPLVLAAGAGFAAYLLLGKNKKKKRR